MMLARAIQYFKRSDYPGKVELIVLDGSDQVHRIGGIYPGLYYHKPTSILQAGIAHNEACELTKGDIVVQWDDDDWQHPSRIRKQVEVLLTHPDDAMCFTSRYYWYHLEQARACKAKSWLGGEGSTGATFAYWKETWKKTPFVDIPVGEDIPFQASLSQRGCPMLDAKDHELLVYMRHNQNGSALTNYQWNPEDSQAARELIGPNDLDFYDGLGELMPVANWNHPNAPGSKMHVMNPMQQLWARHFR
jgi:glycosyltransferase involved in cell wall biosynthesis